MTRDSFPEAILSSSSKLRRRINFSISALITILSFASFDLFEKFGNFPIVPVDRGRLHCTVQRPAKWRERERASFAICSGKPEST